MLQIYLSSLGATPEIICISRQIFVLKHKSSTEKHWSICLSELMNLYIIV
uniref:Uncharacterized protein n=1 Tax=Setaria italica TaxID=4555 RepID=K3YXP0_SETIT